MPLFRFMSVALICSNLCGMNYENDYQTYMHGLGKVIETTGKWCLKPSACLMAISGTWWGMGYKTGKWAETAYGCGAPHGQPSDATDQLTDTSKIIFIVSGGFTATSCILIKLGKTIKDRARGCIIREDSDIYSLEPDQDAISDKTRYLIIRCGTGVSVAGKAGAALASIASLISLGLLSERGSIIGNSNPTSDFCSNIAANHPILGTQLEQWYQALSGSLLSLYGSACLAKLGKIIRAQGELSLGTYRNYPSVRPSRSASPSIKTEDL